MPKGIRARNVLKRALKRRQGGRNLYGIKQGVGKITRDAFPTRRKKRTSASGKKTTALMKNALNALTPHHLPLPRAVGGYTVIRTTDQVDVNTECMLFGAFKGPGAQFSETTWLSAIAVRNGIGRVDDAINDPTAGGNAIFTSSSALEAASLNGAKMVPAAITVQVMNGTALQSANGLAFIGRSKTVLDLMGDSRTWRTVFNELIAYSAPRLCSSGKLALRGVQVNAIPNNLSVLSDFVPRRIIVGGQQEWGEQTFSADFEGFGPIFLYNPDNITLKCLVTIEWRMRFDPLNPAYAGHVTHHPASEATWSKVISDAENAGNGVVDIADVAADVGMVTMVAGLM